tara:strand:- start:239 stop:352 length:114 start_codon:yes stop_codon:yes gene_type:complete
MKKDLTKNKKSLPSMNDVKNSMWGKGKHSTIKTYIKI